jgi:hypothetical protein
MAQTGHPAWAEQVNKLKAMHEQFISEVSETMK